MNPFIRIKEVKVVKEVPKYIFPIENPPTSEELKGWKSRVEGKYYIQLLREEREALKEDWALGQFTGDTVDKTAQLNAKALGRTEQLQDVIDILDDLGEKDEG